MQEPQLWPRAPGIIPQIPVIFVRYPHPEYTISTEAAVLEVCVYGGGGGECGGRGVEG